MPRIALTDRFVSAAKSRGGQRIDYFDANNPGLSLRVSQDDRRTWTLLFTSPKDGKRARLTLGTYPGTSLASARTKALEARGHLDEGKDPRDVLAAEQAATMTVTDLFKSWSQKHCVNLRSAKHVERRMNRNVIPVIGALALRDLHRRDVNRVIDPIRTRSAEVEANRVFDNMRAMFRWAVARGDLDHNPMDGMKKPAVEHARERSLSDDEIRQVWALLPDVIEKSDTVRRIVKLLLLTGQRVGEVAGMRKDELDLKQRVWRLPPTRTKNAAAHAVPLPDAAITIIREALKDAGDNTVFVFPSGKEFIRPRAVARTVHRAQMPTKRHPQGRFHMAEWTPHDLRRTVLTNLAKLGVQPIVIGAIANHLSVTKANVTFAHYVQHDYAKEKAEALDLWAERLQAIIDNAEAATIVTISRVRTA